MSGERKFYQSKSVHGHRDAFNHGYRSAASTGIDEDYFLRQDIEKLTVYNLVYKYLRKCADREGKRKQRNCACNKFQKQHARKKDLGKRAAPLIWINFDEGIFENKSKQLKSHYAHRNVLSRRSSRSSSEKCIASCMKAIYDGQRCAKLYLRKALLYGIRSGLLSPANEQKNILNVSQKLGFFPSKEIRKEPLSTVISDTDCEYLV